MISLYILVWSDISFRSKSKEQLDERRAGLSRFMVNHIELCSLLRRLHLPEEHWWGWQRFRDKTLKRLVKYWIPNTNKLVQDEPKRLKNKPLHPESARSTYRSCPACSLSRDGWAQRQGRSSPTWSRWSNWWFLSRWSRSRSRWSSWRLFLRWSWSRSLPRWSRWQSRSRWSRSRLPKLSRLR